MISCPKVDYRRYSLAHRNRCRQLLHDTFAEYGLPYDGCQLLDDLLTESEITMFARRIEIARRLLWGWSFEHIREEIHVGLRTVVFVDEWLESKLPGYRAKLPHDDIRRRATLISNVWEKLREKYPAHPHLINILL